MQTYIIIIIALC